MRDSAPDNVFLVPKIAAAVPPPHARQDSSALAEENVSLPKYRVVSTYKPLNKVSRSIILSRRCPF
jgi:hypothetical protein